MNHETTDQSQNLITTKLIDFIKEKIWLIVGGLLSGSIIAYVVSRLFIRSYLTEIGYSSQLYSTLSDSSNTAVLSFGIFTTLVLLCIQFFIVPSLIRYFYFENTDLYQDIHDNNKKEVIAFFIICFLSPLSLLLMFVLKISIFYFLLIPYLITLIFIWLFFKKKTLSIKQEVFVLYLGANIGTGVLLSFFPFYILLKAISYQQEALGSSAMIIFIVLWVVYSVVQGYLTAINEKIQYILGVFIAIGIVFEIWILSPNTLNSAITEFVGIKDKEAKIYQISQSDYDKLNQRIQHFWRVGAICNNNNNNDNETKNCKMLVANYDNACTKECDNLVYFNAKVIFRDNKNAIVCPPNYQFGKNMNSRCVLIEQNTITPTAQTADELKNNNNLTLNSFLLES